MIPNPNDLYHIICRDYGVEEIIKCKDINDMEFSIRMALSMGFGYVVIDEVAWIIGVYQEREVL